MFILLFILTLALISKSTVIQSYVDSDILQLIWCGSSVTFTLNDEVVETPLQQSLSPNLTLFALSRLGTIYRQETQSDWKKLNQAVFKDFTPFKSMQLAPGDTQTIYLFRQDGVILYSQNCGVNFTQIVYDKKLRSIKINKMNSSWLIALKSIDCEDCIEGYNNQLYYSSDFGLSWNESIKYVKSVQWDKLIDSSLVPQTRIILSYLQNGSQIVGYSENFQLVNNIMLDSEDFLQTRQYLFLLRKENDSFQLFQTPAFLGGSKPLKIVIPLDLLKSTIIKKLKENTFTVLDTQDGQILLATSQKKNDTASIYISDIHAIQFSLSLLQVCKVPDTNLWEIQKINGIDNVLIANVYESSKKIKTLRKIQQFKKTRITFDRGLSWHPLKPPQYDYLGQETFCSGECSLHLLGSSEQFSSIYSSSSSPGVILGCGNIGLHLTSNISLISTYLSLDGGIVWKEIKKGFYVFDISDRGRTILIAPQNQTINQIELSIDYGSTWTMVQLEQLIMVQSILSEPSSIYQQFVVQGINSEKKDLIIAIQLKTYKSICSQPSEYEYWQSEASCVSGQRQVYQRRKNTSACLDVNGDKIKRIQTKVCECTTEDWVCDFGFYSKVVGGQCIPISENFQNDTSLEQKNFNEQCKVKNMTSYVRNQGYKKQDGNLCQDGIYLGPIEVQCQEDANQKNVISVEVQPQDVVPYIENNNIEQLLLIILGIFVIILFCLKKKISRFFVKKSLGIQDEQISSSRGVNYESIQLGNFEDQLDI